MIFAVASPFSISLLKKGGIIQVMLIQGKNIRSAQKYLGFLSDQETFVIGLRDLSKYKQVLKFYGYDPDIRSTQTSVPYGNKGQTSYNASGKFEVYKDKPKEYRSIIRYYNLPDWQGNYHSGSWVDRKLCYKREFLPPPKIQLILSDGKFYSQPLLNADEFMETNKLIMNMFLEMFGEFEILNEDLSPKIPSAFKRLPWIILPKGECPWEEIEEQIKERISRYPEREQKEIVACHNRLKSMQPSELTVGVEGFKGYLIYTYPQIDTHVFESYSPGNATYVFGENWESASILSKATIIKSSLHKERVVHTSNWPNKINDLFMNKQ